MTAVMDLQGVTRVFPGDPPIEVLRGVDLTIYAGETLSIIGPSGSGKSTLLNVMGLLDVPTAGTFHLDGIDVRSLSDGERAALRGSRLGFVFQAFHLLSHRSVIENVMLGELYLPPGKSGNGQPRNTDKASRFTRAESALTKVNLAHRLHHKPTRLSGGERQRVAIARAIVHGPSLLLADEPTGNLDSENTEAALQLFDDLRDEGLTICMITHDGDVAKRADRTVRMLDGRLKSVERN
jgi:putative ABC transport system ATP-binding protein